MTHKNHCGECTACCTVLGVKDLQKPEYTPCTHLCATGCAVYEKRPTECQTYECLWLATNTRGEAEMPLELRPDQCGLIVEVQDVKFGQAVVVRDVWPGAYENSEIGQNYVWAVAKNLDAMILLITNGGRKFILPPWKAHLRKQIERVKMQYMDEQGGTTRIRLSSESRLKTTEASTSNERRSGLKDRLRKKHKQQRQARKKNRR